MGVGTLIVFIALLLVAAVAAGVLIQTSGTLQEKALATGSLAKDQIATNIEVVQVSGTNGTDAHLNEFEVILKLAAGSSPIPLDTTILTYNTRNASSTLRYRGVDGTTALGNDGFNTWLPEELGLLRQYYTLVERPGDATQITFTVLRNLRFDLDNDGVNDSAVVCRDETWGFCADPYDNYYILFRLTSAGDHYIQAVGPSGGPVNLANPVTIANERTPIGDFGYVTINGTTGGGWRIGAVGTSNWVWLERPENWLAEDLDDDGSDDHLQVNQTHAIFFLSSGPTVAVGMDADIGTSPVAISVNKTVASGGTTYARIYINGTTTQDNVIDENMTFKVTPERLGEGYYAAEYLQQGPNYVPGVLQRGDMLRLFLESNGDIGESEHVRVGLIPRVGTPTRIEFYTPDVISSKRVYVYP